MDLSVHNVLVGYGAHKFALSQGLKKEETLHPDSKVEWKEWLAQRAKGGQGGKGDSHDTIGDYSLPSFFHFATPIHSAGDSPRGMTQLYE
mgnify:CR=1 FL=1